MEMTELEQRMTRIEDIEAIKQLKARYAFICDDLHNPDTIASVFAEDGIWENETLGKATGHAEISALFSKFRDMFTFSQHNMSNPVITIDGDRATGIWYITSPHDVTEDDKKVWIAARYDDDYVKVDGEWKHQHLRADIRMMEDR